MDNKLNQTPLATTIAEGQLADAQVPLIEPAAREPRDGSTMHYATLRLSDEPRHRLLRTLALTHGIASSLIGVREPPVVQTKLQWWSDEIGRLYQNEPRHPLTQSCVDWLGDRSDVQTHLNTVLDAAAAARFDAPETDSDWLAVVGRDYSARLQLVYAALASQSKPAPDFENFALSAAWIDILRTLPSRIHHDQIAFPPSLYERFSLNREQLLKQIRVEGRSSTDDAADEAGYAAGSNTTQATKNNHHSIKQLLQAGISEGLSATDATIASNTYALLRAEPETRALTAWLQMRRAQLRLWQNQEPNLLRETITITPLRKWFIAFRQR